MQKVIVLPKDDQEVEELMLEEVEVFKVGEVPPCPVHSTLPLSGPQPLTLDLSQGWEGSAGSQTDPSFLPGTSSREDYDHLFQEGEFLAVWTGSEVGACVPVGSRPWHQDGKVKHETGREGVQPDWLPWDYLWEES